MSQALFLPLYLSIPLPQALHLSDPRSQALCLPMYLSVHLSVSAPVSVWVSVYAPVSPFPYPSYLEVDGCHIAKLPWKWNTLIQHMHSLLRVPVSFQKHAVETKRLEHLNQRLAEHLKDGDGGENNYMCISFDVIYYRVCVCVCVSVYIPVLHSTRPRQGQLSSSGAAVVR